MKQLMKQLMYRAWLLACLLVCLLPPPAAAATTYREPETESKSGLVTEAETETELETETETEPELETKPKIDYTAQLAELKAEIAEQNERLEAINSTEVEELHERYSVNELRLENQRTRQRLMRQLLVVLTAVVLGALVGIALLVGRRRKVRLYDEKLKQAITEYQHQLSNTNLFLSNMSHEIRTPLNALSGFSDLLATPGVDATTQQVCHEMIAQNSDLLQKLMNDVVEYSCTNPQEMAFAFETTDVVQLCQRVVATLNQVKTTQATLAFRTPYKQLLLHTDATRLQQVLINLLMNANKFTPQGTILLELQPMDREELHFSVTDTGTGIPLSDQSRLFTRYEKLNEQVQGTGLGLAICKAILNRLGGDIWLDATYTQGARFVCSHPYTVNRSPMANPLTASSSMAKPSPMATLEVTTQITTSC